MNTIGEGKPWKFSTSARPAATPTCRSTASGCAHRTAQRIRPDAPRPAQPVGTAREFYRACDVYDWTNVGFVSSGADAEREGVRFNTRDRGNSNAGHLYGASLDPASKAALLEYLKTK